MKVSLGIVTAGIAAVSLASPYAMAQQNPAPRARSAQSIFVQRGGGGYLGIGGIEVTSERAKALSLREERGVEISRVVEDSPAAKAGIQKGDVILELNGTPVQGTVQLQRMVGEIPPGREVKLMIWRNGAPQTLNVTLGDNKEGVATFAPDGVRSWNWDMPTPPEMPRMPEMNIPRFEMLMPSPALGIYGEPMADADQLAEFFGVTDGILVRSVRKGSAAEKAGIKAGDVITKLDDQHVSNSGDITRMLRGLKGRKPTFTVTVVRNKKEMPVTVTLETSGTTTRASLIVFNG